MKQVARSQAHTMHPPAPQTSSLYLPSCSLPTSISLSLSLSLQPLASELPLSALFSQLLASVHSVNKLHHDGKVQQQFQAVRLIHHLRLARAPKCPQTDRDGAQTSSHNN